MMHEIPGPDGRTTLVFPTSRFIALSEVVTDGKAGTMIYLDGAAPFMVLLPLAAILPIINPKK